MKKDDYNYFCFKYNNIEYIFRCPETAGTSPRGVTLISRLKLENELSKVTAADRAAAAEADEVAKRQCVVKGEAFKNELQKKTLSVSRPPSGSIGITFTGDAIAKIDAVNEQDTGLPKVLEVAGNAEAAGLQKGDYIHKVNETDVFCTGDFKKVFSNPQTLEFKVNILRGGQPEEQAEEQSAGGGGIATDDSGNDSGNDSDNESSLLKIRPYRSETESSDHSDWSSEWSDSEED